MSCERIKAVVDDSGIIVAGAAKSANELDDGTPMVHPSSPQNLRRNEYIDLLYDSRGLCARTQGKSVPTAQLLKLE